MPTITPQNMSSYVQQTPPTQQTPPPAIKQQNTSEAPVKAPDEVTKSPAEDTMAPKFAALARKEQAFRARMREVDAREQAMKAREGEIESAAAWKAKLTSDPWSVMIDAGMTPEQATEVILNQPKPDDLKFTSLQKEIQALKSAQTAAEARAADQQKLQYEQAKKQIGNEVKMLVDADPNFETVKAMDAQEVVVELIENTFNEEGYLMSIEDATLAVEEHLVEEAYKFTQLKKIQSKLKPAEPPITQPQKSPAPPKSPLQTLTNRVTQTSTTHSSAKDRRARAIAAFMGQKPE